MDLFGCLCIRICIVLQNIVLRPRNINLLVSCMEVLDALRFTNPAEFKLYLLGVSNTKHVFCEIFISMFMLILLLKVYYRYIQGNFPMLFVLFVVIWVLIASACCGLLLSYLTLGWLQNGAGSQLEPYC